MKNICLFQTNVSLAIIDLELLQILKHLKLGKYHDKSILKSI